MPNHIAKSTGFEFAIQHLPQKFGFALAQRFGFAAKFFPQHFIQAEG
jgi:hypothetical protein